MGTSDPCGLQIKKQAKIMDGWILCPDSVFYMFSVFTELQSADGSEMGRAACRCGVLTLSERVQRQAGLSWLDGEKTLPLKVEQVLLLDLLDLQELLLESQLLGRNLLQAKHTHIHTQHNNQHNSWFKPTKEALVHTICV